MFGGIRSDKCGEGRGSWEEVGDETSLAIMEEHALQMIN